MSAFPLFGIFDRLRSSPLWRQHLVVLLLLLLLSASKAWYSWGIGMEYPWTGDTSDTYYSIVMEFKERPVDREVSLFARIVQNQWRVLRDQPPTQWYAASFRSFLGDVYLGTGDISISYKMLVFPINLIFLSGAYLLFFNMTRSWKLGLVLAVAASLQFTLSWAGEKMGIGPVWGYSRRHIFTAFLPWLVLAFLYSRNNYRHLLLTFCAAGLAANLHASGLLLVQILALTWLLTGPFSVRRLLQCFLLLLVAVLMAFYAMGSMWGRALGHITNLLVSGLVPAVHAEGLLPIMEAVREKIPFYWQYLSYPPREYQNLPRLQVDLWFLTTVVLGFAPLLLRRWAPRWYETSLFVATASAMFFISASQFDLYILFGIVLYGMGRAWNNTAPQSPDPLFENTCFLILSCFWVSVLGQMLFQLAHLLVPGFPLVFDQLRGIRFMGFLVFLWLATLPVAAWGASKWRKPAALVLVLLFCVGQGKDIYRKYYRGLHETSFQDRAALLDLALWAKTHTPAEASFLVGSSGFGIVSERRVTHTDKSAQWPDAPALAPRAQVAPAQALEAALKLGVDHVVVGSTMLDAAGRACILQGNERFAILETACLRASAVAARG